MARAFVVVGAMKSGTSTLEGVLRGLPEVDLIAEKETSAFLNNRTAELAARAIRQSGRQVAGEVSTAYMQRPLHEVNARHVAHLLGTDLVVIAVMRDPFHRALSHWRHWAQLGLNKDQDMSTELTDPSSPYVAFSRYSHQLSPWEDALGVSKILTLRLEDYISDPRNWVEELCRTLSIQSPDKVQSLHVNDADSRVVATGIGHRVMQSRAYRRHLRPLVPSAIRRVGNVALGGQRGGQELGPFPEDLEAAFRQVIASDAAELTSRWAHLKWAPTA